MSRLACCSLRHRGFYGNTILYGTILYGHAGTVTDDHQLADAMRSFITRSHLIMDRRMRAEGVSLARFKLLSFIGQGPSVRSADIMSAFGYSPRTVTEALDAVEREGLIERHPDPTDRRAKRITITPAGEAALRQSEPLRNKLRDDLFGVLDAEERAALSRALEKMNRRMEALEGRPGSSPASEDT